MKVLRINEFLNESIKLNDVDTLLSLFNKHAEQKLYSSTVIDNILVILKLAKKSKLGGIRVLDTKKSDQIRDYISDVVDKKKYPNIANNPTYMDDEMYHNNLEKTLKKIKKEL